MSSATGSGTFTAVAGQRSIRFPDYVDNLCSGRAAWIDAFVMWDPVKVAQRRVDEIRPPACLLG
jgi:hypothetical protein